MAAVERLGEADLGQICNQMARQVEEMAENYESPTSLQLGTIQKLTKAFELAKAAKAPPAPTPAPRLRGRPRVPTAMCWSAYSSSMTCPGGSPPATPSRGSAFHPSITSSTPP